LTIYRITCRLAPSKHILSIDFWRCIYGCRNTLANIRVGDVYNTLYNAQVMNVVSFGNVTGQAVSLTAETTTNQRVYMNTYSADVDKTLSQCRSSSICNMNKYLVPGKCSFLISFNHQFFRNNFHNRNNETRQCRHPRKGNM